MKRFSTFVVVVALLLLSATQLFSQPNLSAPPSGANYVTTTPTLYWWYITTGTESYTVQIATDAGFTAIVHSASVSGGGSASYTVPSSILSSGVPYYWRIGVGGSFSTGWTFTPSTGTFGGSGSPMLSAPPNGSTYGIGTSVSLYWYYITTGAPTYTVEVSTASDFSTIFYTTTTTSVSATVSGLSYGVPYYWRVKADGFISTEWTFTPTNSTFTSDIYLTHPGNGFTNIPTTQSFYWYGGTAPYTLEIATSSDFTTGLTSYPGVAIGYEVSGLLAGTTYHWRVKDASFTTTGWSFTTTGAAAPTYDWYVDASNTNLTPDGSLGNPFTTISAAITAATAGQTIYVADGSYTETLTIDKGVSITGTGCTNVTVTGSHTITASNVAITGINFVTAGTAIIISTTASVIDSVDITYCCFTLPSPGIGVYLGGGTPAFKLSNVEISYCEFNGPVDMISNPIKVGGSFGSPIGLELEDLDFSYNTVDKGSIPINIYDKNISELDFTYNTFTNTDGALYVWNTTTPATGVFSDFLFKHNTIDATNSYGIAFGIPTVTNLVDDDFGADIQVTHNNFGAIPGAYGMGAIHVEGASTFILDAELNWWETTSGPSHSGNTYVNAAGDPQGAAVSDNVDYVPWLAASHMGVGAVQSFAPATNPLGGKYSSIQAAVDAAAINNNINAAAGTFTELVDITTNGLNIAGAGSSLTSIKGTKTTIAASWPLAEPNVNINADNVKLHDFKFVGPDYAAGFYSTGILLDGTGIEIYNNEFNVASAATLGEISQAIVSVLGGGIDISGLKIYDNIFTHHSTNIWGFEAIYINRDGGTSLIYIEDNQFTGEVLRAITVERSNAEITGNSIVTDLARTDAGLSTPGAYQGINIRSTASVTDILIDNNVITGSASTFGFYQGLRLGNAAFLLDDVLVTNNNITYCEIGIFAAIDFTTSGANALIINNNTIKDNVTSGLDAVTSTGSATYYIVDAKNNYWGSTDGPEDLHWYDTGIHAGTSYEMDAGSANPVKTWVNQNAENSGTLGNAVIDNDNLDAGAGGLFIEYYPWQTGTPVLDVADASTTIGATVSLPVTVSFLGSPINYTLTGSFTYNTSELDYLSADYGVGTLLNGSGWSATFVETTPGTVFFVAYGVSPPISTDGTLFKLLFKVIDSGAGSSVVTGNNADFFAGGSPLFGSVGTFSGTVTYSGAAPAPLKGDADLDGNVDIDDLTLVAQYINNAVSFNALQIANADVDGDLDVDGDDLSDITFYIAFGSWPAPAPEMGGGVPTVTFANIMLDDNGLMEFPVLVNNASQVRNVELTINYDEEVIDYQTFSKMISGQYNQVHSIKTGEGQAKFLYAAPAAVSGDVLPGKFVMKLKESFPEGSVISTRVKVNGGEEVAGPSFVFGDGVTSVDETIEIPSNFVVEQNYPNPFNPSTTISFAIPEASYVSIKIYDMLGQEVKALIKSDYNPGTYNVLWNGDDNFGNRVASGTYLYRVVSGSKVMTKKMVLLK